MYKRLPQIIALFFCCILLIASFSGCIKEKQKTEEILIPKVKLDQLSVLPDWKDGDYHDYYETTDLLSDFQVKYPDLVNVFSIGKSVLGKDIWCIRITNEKNNVIKSSCLIDGCIHGCEWEAGEACLYLAEYLLINFDKNDTITNILNSSNVYIIPLVNPDGRQDDYRFNENGIDLNRNFDIDFGRIRGYSIPLGKIFGRIKIPYLEFPRLSKWFKSFPVLLTNSGRRAFSEPESQAIRDFMKEIQYNDFSFYLNCHTAGQCVLGSWLAYKPPFKMSQHELNIINEVTSWVGENTDYEGFKSGEELIIEGKPFYMSGNIMDWCYKEFHIPSFAFEILSSDYEPWTGGGKHDNLVYWMKTTLPVSMYLLVNIDNLRQWKTPDIQPPLPEGVPPEPLQ